MTPEQWDRVTELFEEGCERPAHARDTWLSSVADEAAVRDEVRAMLAAYDTDPGFLERPVDAAQAVTEAMADALIGRRLGAYKLLRQIGRGGMGVVYEAERDDQEFDRRAAVKILPAWQAAFADRFVFERRVLAGLDHSGIARLLDAGTTRDGITYFVMEFVDGQPVTAWCAERALDLHARVRLVERIAEAVGYAHRHLVVHRDLKPGNILVTAEGDPKLLDFGIAALLSDDGATAGTTRTGHHSFTPEFASPEQIRGERVTTASDVYSLGVLLYVLLAGRHPYALHGLSPLEVMRTVCEVDPPRPSGIAPPAARAALRGDLEAIIGKALAKDPSERYDGVGELAADLKAWRTGHPVSAAPASMGYRARRFITRNKKAVAAAAALTITLVGGATATAWQARIAREERDKAQNRFRQVQEFSRSLLFDVHNSLRQLPGATEPRRLLLNRAVQFLDGLAADVGDDDALKLELVEGYRRLGHVQGASNSENLGDTAAALQSFERATALAEAAVAGTPDAVDPLVAALNATADLMAIRQERGDTPGASRVGARHMELVERLAQHRDSSLAMARAAGGYVDAGGHAASASDYATAQHYYSRAVELFEALPQAERNTDRVIEEYASALKRLGAVLMRDDLAASERRYRQALALDQEALRRAPDSAANRYAITFTMSDLALVAHRQGKVDEAAAMWRQALSIRQAMLDADPKNVRAMVGVATLFNRLGRVAQDRSRLEEAAKLFGDELALRERVVAVQGPLPARVTERAWSRLRLAEVRLTRADTEPRDPARRAWIDEARRLVAATARGDGKNVVPAGSEPGFLELHDRLTSRLSR